MLMTRQAAELERIAPMCARCGRRVERITVWPMHDLLMGTRFVVECHGASEEVFVPMTLILEGAELQPGIAFAEQALEAPCRSATSIPAAVSVGDE